MFKDIKYYSQIIIVLIGELALLLIFVIFPGSNIFTPNLRAEVIWFRFFTLLTGAGIIIFTLIQFLRKYVKNPSKIRFTILISLVFFLGSSMIYSFRTVFIFDQYPLFDRYIMDLPIIFLMLSVYCLVLFGLNVLITPNVEKRGEKLKTFLNILLVVSYGCYFIDKVLLKFFNPVETLFSDIVQYLLYAYASLNIVFLVIMAIKSLALYKKTADLMFKRGLLSLSIAFIILVASVLLLIVNIIFLEENRIIIVLFVCFLVVGLYFVYSGFVKPKTG